MAGPVGQDRVSACVLTAVAALRLRSRCFVLMRSYRNTDDGDDARDKGNVRFRLMQDNLLKIFF